MSTLQNRETLTSSDQPSAGQTAEVIDLLECLQEHRPVAELGDIAVNAVQSETLQRITNWELLYYPDKKRVKEARGDPGLLADLLSEYRRFIYHIANSYSIKGGETDDLAQEGMVGFWEAVRDYDGQSSSFKSFAQLCVSRQIMTAARDSRRLKHKPLNSSISYSHIDEDLRNGDFELLIIRPGLVKVLTEESRLTEDASIGREAYEDLNNMLATKLSSLEQNVIMMRLEGKSYEETAVLLDTNVRAVNNAIQRAKQKILEYLERDADEDQSSADASPSKDRSLKDIFIAYEAVVGPDVLSSMLTELENDVLRMHAEDKSNEAIAKKLRVSVRAVDKALELAKEEISKYLDAIESFSYSKR